MHPHHRLHFLLHPLRKDVLHAWTQVQQLHYYGSVSSCNAAVEQIVQQLTRLHQDPT